MRRLGLLLAALPAGQSLRDSAKAAPRAAAGKIHRPKQADHSKNQRGHAEVAGLGHQQVRSRGHHRRHGTRWSPTSN